MAIKPCHLIPFVSLIFLLFAPIGNAALNFKPLSKFFKPNGKPNIPEVENFLKSDGSRFKAILEKAVGMEFGEVVENVNHGIELANLLLEYGFLKPYEKKKAADYKKEVVSAALAYQKKYHIKPPGKLDRGTFLTMLAPRCAVPDMANGANSVFFPKNRRWNKTHLTYRFLSSDPRTDLAPVQRAFRQWEAATNFTFARVGFNQASDLVIGYTPFKRGSGGRLAFALAHPPTKGLFFLNGNEKFSVAPSHTAFHLETIAVHEIGHLLGLHHSGDKETIMYPIFKRGEVKTKLHPDDIKAIKDLYNPPN